MFKYSVRGELTRRYYERRLRKFFEFIKFSPEKDIEKVCNYFADKAIKEPRWTLNCIVGFLQFQKLRVEHGEITAATLSNFVKAIKLFCEMSEIPIPWKKITRGLPRARESSNDRAPSVDEIRKLVEYPDRRIKPIIYTMISSGIRIGAWDHLKWKHISPIRNEKNELMAARITVYADDVEEYFSFITPEAYQALADWMDFRASFGEVILEHSFLMRDLWQTTNARHTTRNGLAAFPKKLKSSGIRRLIERALWEQGLRRPLKPGERRHEWKTAHGFRKFYKTRAEQVMKPINVEITMGHNIGVSSSYYKPTEKEVLDDYLNAIALLTIKDESRLQQKIENLQDRQNEIDLVKLKYEKDLKEMREEMESKFNQILAKVDLLKLQSD
jgi:hypothetical protein